jgi:hypothetical protein
MRSPCRSCSAAGGCARRLDNVSLPRASLAPRVARRGVSTSDVWRVDKHLARATHHAAPAAVRARPLRSVISSPLATDVNGIGYQLRVQAKRRLLVRRGPFPGASLSSAHVTCAHRLLTRERARMPVASQVWRLLGIGVRVCARAPGCCRIRRLAEPVAPRFFADTSFHGHGRRR